MRKELFISAIVIVLLFARIGVVFFDMKTGGDVQTPGVFNVEAQVLGDETPLDTTEPSSKEKVRQIFAQRKEIPLGKVHFQGPGEDVPQDVPGEDGFLSFGIPVAGVLTRSGQPKLKHYEWLKDQGGKSVVNLRKPGEYGEKARDTQIKGFKELGFNYLELPIKDGAAPTDEQAEEFLVFVMSPENQPVHVHCRAGYGRAGTLVALYRYAVQGWPLDSAIKESRLYSKGISKSQETWLRKWAARQQKETQ